MGTQSIVHGYIVLHNKREETNAMQHIDGYHFDDVWPFTNIFLGVAAARYDFPVIGFAGSYKQVEQAWSEWLWKFADMLRGIDAIEAQVWLDCVIGIFHWELEPDPKTSGDCAAGSFVGQRWVITKAPEKDFSIDPQWTQYVAKNLRQIDPVSGKETPYCWTQIVPRVLGGNP
jgi:hypothetical protein